MWTTAHLRNLQARHTLLTVFCNGGRDRRLISISRLHPTKMLCFILPIHRVPKDVGDFPHSFIILNIVDTELISSLALSE